MYIDSSTIQQFQSDIRKRRALHRRDLPWRKTTDPYKIWISETMLCQTQVSRVISYYKERMRIFPTVNTLAQATNTEVLSARSGLGYNSRGLRVLQAAKQIVENSTWKTKSSVFPNTYEELIALPGVGDYVANAILAFAYNHDVAVIDTNIRRILIHHFSLPEDISLKELKDIALQVLPIGYAREWYNALMDYGALELTAKKSGIRPLTRQSKFEGSRRQVRAWIVKQLVNKWQWKIISSESQSNQLWTITLTIDEISNRFPDRDDIQSIIDDLVKENIIIVNDWVLKICN